MPPRKRKQSTDLVPVEQELPPSLTVARIGNRSYPMRTYARCRVCTHPKRALIEEKLLNPHFPLKAIAEFATGLREVDVDGIEITWPEITERVLDQHRKQNHMGLTGVVAQRFAEQRADELGISYEEATSRVVDHVTALRGVVYRGQERLVNGEVDVGVKEMISAAKALAAIEHLTGAAAAEQGQDSIQQAMDVYFTTAQQIMTDEQWQQFAAVLSTHPVLRALAERANPSVIDAEVVQ